MPGRLKLILASGSPRRLQLLGQIGVEPDRVAAVTVDESPKKNELPRNLAKRLANEKAVAAMSALAGDPDLDGALILAADTVVGLGSRCLPKAELIDQAAACLRQLSGRAHRVYTGLSLVTPGRQIRQRLVLAGAFVVKLSGSYTNVVGLPLYETMNLLTGEGYPIHFNWVSQG